MRTKQHNITIQMKKTFLRMIFCTVAVILNFSCADETKYEYSSDCAITSFTLGSITRTMHTTDSDGEDSTYTITYSGSYYPMTIDQVNMKIYNRDSLPYGSSVKSVLATISAYGQVAYRETGFEGEVIADWKVYSSSDSIDFSNPVIFRVVSNDGKGEKDYEVQVNVAQQEEQTIQWHEESANSLSEMEKIQAIAWQDSLFVFGVNSQSQIMKSTRYIGADNQAEISWKTANTTGCEQGNIRSIQLLNNKLYMSTSSGKLLISDNGTNWETIPQTQNVDLLIGCDSQNLYALISGAIYRSADNGMTWNEEVIDASNDCLPTEDVAAIRYTQGNNIERLLIAGSRNHDIYPADTATAIISKLLNIDDEESWMHYNADSYNDYLLPRMENLHIVRMHQNLIAFGGSVNAGNTQKPFEAFYISIDNGITWKPNYNDITVPENLNPYTNCFSGCTDEQGRFWLICGSQVWKGIN